MSGSSSSEGILEGLNAPQREAVLANDGPVSLFMAVDEQHLSIAGTGTASHQSFIRAIRLAIQLSQRSAVV